jgi:hypothetical protein
MSRLFDTRPGLILNLHVFTAQAGLLANQLTVITRRVQQTTRSVQLIESLGGGSNDYPAPDRTAGPIFTVLCPSLTQDMRPLTDINVL